MEPITKEQVDEFLAAQRRLDLGQAQCRALCKRVLPVEDVITLYYRNTLIIAVCTDCFAQVDLITSMSPDGLTFNVKPRASLISL